MVLNGTCGVFLGKKRAKKDSNFEMIQGVQTWSRFGNE